MVLPVQLPAVPAQWLFILLSVGYTEFVLQAVCTGHTVRTRVRTARRSAGVQRRGDQHLPARAAVFSILRFELLLRVRLLQQLLLPILTNPVLPCGGVFSVLRRLQMP